MIMKALKIVNEKFRDKVDKSGKPYILHLLRVMKYFFEEDYQVTALLHDVVEDTDISFDELKEMGFNDNVIDALVAITKIKDEDYDDYINRVLKNEIALKVKFMDIWDNMDLSRYKKITDEEYNRVLKYKEKFLQIASILGLKKRPIYISGFFLFEEKPDLEKFYNSIIKLIDSQGWSFEGSIGEEEFKF